MVRQKRLSYINFLQMMGVLLVIIGHSLEPYVYKGYLGGSFIINEKCKELYKFINSFHMPLFFFIYGYLFAYKEHNRINLVEYTKKRFKRLIVPFYLFALLVWIPFLYFLGHTNAAENFLSFKNCYHLWFLPTLFIIGLVYSIILKTPLKKHTVILLIFLIFWQCSYYDGEIVKILYRRPMNNIVYTHIGFMVAIYIASAKEHSVSETEVLKRMCFLLGILYIAIFFVNDFQLKLKLRLDLYTVIDNWKLQVFLPVTKLEVIFKIILLFTATKILLIYWPHVIDTRMTQLISENLLTIYLFHQGFNWMFYKILKNTVKNASFWSLAGIEILVLLSSLAVAETINMLVRAMTLEIKTKKHSNLIICSKDNL